MLDVDDMLRPEREREREPPLILTGSKHNRARPSGPDDLEREQADRARPGDDDNILRQRPRKLERAVDDACERFGERAGDIIDIRRQPVDVLFGNNHIARETAIDSRTDRLAAWAEVRPAGAAKTARPAGGEEGFGRDP